MKSSKPQIFLLFISIVSILVSLAVLFWATILQEQSHTDQFWEELYWEKAIDSEGGEKAYAQLRRLSATWAYLPTHQALHAFGFALYNKFGLEGATYCDDYQRFGCFHGVLAAYISSEGISSLDRINSVCLLNNLSSENRCFHGIGHGLVDYLGRSNLNRSLIVCQKINSMAFLGCPHGALMEYFTPIKTASKNTPYEQFDENNLFGPCEKLSSEFQKYCYFFIPSFYWPYSVSSNPLKAEGYCLTINNTLFKHLCLAGIGTKASNSSNFDLVKSQNLCLQMKDVSSQIYCSAGVNWNKGSAEGSDISDNLCSHWGKQAEDDCAYISQMLNS